MKRLIFILLLSLGGSLCAQTVDSTASAGERVLGDEPQVRTQRERNVLGAPVYYDTLGNVIGQHQPSDGVYRRPRHHFHNRLENDFNNFFFEFQMLLGGRQGFATGAMLTWLPQRWGLYGSALVNWDYGHYSIGPALRLSDCGDYFDWQLYGGLAFDRRVGFEGGMRIAGPRSQSGFAWTSLSLGGGYVHGHGYMTFGLSLLLAPEMAFIFWF